LSLNRASLNFTSFVTAEYSFICIYISYKRRDGRKRIIKNNHNKE